MNNNKQSSVEWLDKQLTSLNFDYITGQVSNKEYNDKSKQILKKAKAMHMEEIKNAIIFADCRGENKYTTVDSYYTETFGGDNDA